MAKTEVRTISQPRWVSVAYWVLCGLLALLFLAAGTAKIAGQQMMVAEFAHVGVGQWFRYLTGVLEIGGAIALLVPRASALGAVLLIFVVAGAGITQAFVLHGDWIHAVVIGVLLGGVIYLRRRYLWKAQSSRPIS